MTLRQAMQLGSEKARQHNATAFVVQDGADSFNLQFYTYNRDGGMLVAVIGADGKLRQGLMHMPA